MTAQSLHISVRNSTRYLNRLDKPVSNVRRAKIAPDEGGEIWTENNSDAGATFYGVVHCAGDS